MDRRAFLRGIGGAIASAAIVPAIPLGRVWSFPKNIVIPKLSLEEMEQRYLAPAVEQLRNDIDGLFQIGDIVSLPAFGIERYIVTGIQADSIKIQKAEQDKLGFIFGAARRHLRKVPLWYVDELEDPAVAAAVEKIYSGGPPGSPPVAQLKSGFAWPDFGMPES